MHYPHRVSKVKRHRKQGFRTRMKTRGGRKIFSRQRRIGRKTLGIGTRTHRD